MVREATNQTVELLVVDSRMLVSFLGIFRQKLRWRFYILLPFHCINW